MRSFAYDPLYRRISETWVDPHVNPNPIFSYAYNDAGELTSAASPHSQYPLAYNSPG